MKSRSRTPLPFVLLAAALSSAVGHGAIVYSGLQNIAVTNTFASVYVDVDGFSSGSAPTVGWDLEAFFGGEAIGNNDNFQPARQTVALDAPILRLDAGATLDGSFAFASQAAGSQTHIGAAPDQFASGVEGYFGFRLIENDGDGPYYGWMRVILSNTGSTGTLVDWAYDNTGAPVTVGLVPEPASLALLAAGGGMLALRRRRS